MRNDIAMWVGENSYPWPSDFTDEARRLGVSKQVPRTAIPAIEPGVSRLVLIHPRALISVCADGMTLIDLGAELENTLIGECETLDESRAYAYEYLIDPETGRNLLEMVKLLKVAEMENLLKNLEKKYEIKYRPGFIGYTYLTGIQYIAKADEDCLPLDLVGIPGIEAVRVEYEEGQ